MFWHCVHVLMSFLSQKKEREEFPLQQVSSKGARPCVKLISYLCFSPFVEWGKTPIPTFCGSGNLFRRSTDRNPSGFQDLQQLTQKHRWTCDESVFVPPAFILWCRKKHLLPIIASGFQSWWKREAWNKRWPWEKGWGWGGGVGGGGRGV